MLIAIIRAHFSAQHAASEDKDQTHTKWGRERKKEKESEREGATRKCLEKNILLLRFFMRMGFGKATQITQNEKSA